MAATDLLQWLSDYLVQFGTGVLFVVCVLETAIFVGLILPVGGLIAVSAMLASRGVLDPASVILAAFSGALIGDQLGFAVGRWFVATTRPPKAGRISRLWAGAIGRTDSLIRGRGLLGISVARTVPFVRTIMPWFAGRSGVSWARFTIYDFFGILLWGTVYIGGGFLAGMGWRTIAGQFGEGAGAVVVGALMLIFLLAGRRPFRRLLERRRGPRSPAGPRRTKRSRPPV
jgi:membrane-associated protein